MGHLSGLQRAEPERSQKRNKGKGRAAGHELPDLMGGGGRLPPPEVPERPRVSGWAMPEPSPGREAGLPKHRAWGPSPQSPLPCWVPGPPRQHLGLEYLMSGVGMGGLGLLLCQRRARALVPHGKAPWEPQRSGPRPSLSPCEPVL